MKIEILKIDQIQNQLNQIAKLPVLDNAISYLSSELEQTYVDLDMEDKVHDELKKIIGKTEAEIEELRAQDCFLDTLIDDYWTAPFDKDMQRCEKTINLFSNHIKQTKTNIIKLYNMLNPSVEFLKSLYHEYAQRKFPKGYAPEQENWVSLLKKSEQPDFHGFNDSEKIKILCGPICDFLRNISFQISQYSITPINQIKLDDEEYFSFNLPRLLAQKQATLYVPPHLTRFVFRPINDEYDRALLRITAFNDMIIMVRDYLNQSNKQKSFCKMDQIGLQEFNFHVNNWVTKIYPECKKKLYEKKSTFVEIIQIMQNFLNHIKPPKTDRTWLDTSRELTKFCNNLSKENKPEPKFSEYEYQVIYFDLLYNNLPTKARVVMQEAYTGFTPDNISNLQDTNNTFFDSVFIGQLLGIQNMNSETIYSLASGINLKNMYTFKNMCKISQSNELCQAFDNALKNIVKLNPSKELLKLAETLSQQKQH